MVKTLIVAFLIVTTDVRGMPSSIAASQQFEGVTARLGRHATRGFTLDCLRLTTPQES
jgi:hypothetical protein